MERPLKKYKLTKVDSLEQAGFWSLPTEIIFKIFDEYSVYDLYDLLPLSCSCSFLYNIFRQSSYWRDRYYREYNIHDELEAAEPTHRIKFFLWSFLPPDYATNSNGYDWCRSYRSRRIYDNAIQQAVNACAFRERRGWMPLDPTNNNNYHKRLSKNTFSFGFRYDYSALFDQLDVTADNNNGNIQELWLKNLLNLPCIVDIKEALDLCFLELTFDAFIADPEAILISVIDPFHFSKTYNPHIAHAKDLCSLDLPPIPEPSYALTNNDYNEEPVILPGENIEICEYGQRRWGFYTNCDCEGLLWGADLNALLENKYHSEYFFDSTIFKLRNYIRNFSDMFQ